MSLHPSSAPHIPVLIDDVMTALAPQPGEIHIDATFGAGGYSARLLEAGAEVYGIDRDPTVAATGAALVARYGGRFHFCAGRFGAMQALMADAGVAQVHGIVFDIGVSSMHLDQPERGFSFMADGPLDMRMGLAGETAAEWIDRSSEAAIADAIYHYGEEPKARRIARFIVEARPIASTLALAQLVRRAVGYHPGKKDPAPQVFQALRIAVNDELAELEQGLAAAEALLCAHGRLAVVSFHSLEDRIVKQFLRRRSGGEGAGSRHLPRSAEAHPAPTFCAVAKPVRADAAEIAANPRARSAILRSAVRSDAAPWPAALPSGGGSR